MKSTRNSSSHAPAGLVAELPDMSVRPVLTVVTEKEDLREPHAGNDKRPVPGQSFGKAGFEGPSLHTAVKEHLDRLPPIGGEVLCPRDRIGWQLLRCEHCR